MDYTKAEKFRIRMQIAGTAVGLILTGLGLARYFYNNRPVIRIHEYKFFEQNEKGHITVWFLLDKYRDDCPTRLDYHFRLKYSEVKYAMEWHGSPIGLGNNIVTSYIVTPNAAVPLGEGMMGGAVTYGHPCNKRYEFPERPYVIKKNDVNY